MAAEELVLELALILGIAAVLAIIGRLVKQPPVIAYLLTGILIGPLVFNILKSPDLIKVFAHLGVTFLLFLIGLSLNFRSLKETGKVTYAIGIGQVTLTSLAGFFIAKWLGFANIPAFFLAAALAFSSTVVVMKMLSDKKETETLHGRIITGTVIIQNIIAALVLMLIPIIGTADVSFIGEKIVKGIFLIAIVFLTSHLVIPGILSLAAKSQEVLLIFSVGWAFLIASVFYLAGYSIEMGALIAGMSLASSKFSLDISSKIKGLREFFVMIHLIFFGSLLVGPITTELIKSAAIFSALILIGNPLIVMTIMKFFGYKKKTSFLTGTSIAQISEFSLIIVFLSYTLNILPRETLSLVVLIAIITIAISSYAIYYSDRFYKIFSPLIAIFDGKGNIEKTFHRKKDYRIILFGYNRIGFNLLKAFKKTKKSFIVIDFNPKTIEELSAKGIDCIYGDAEDAQLLKELKLNEAETIISTIPDLEINLQINQKITNDKVKFIPTAHNIEDARKLYDSGADYVIMPHFLGGHYIAELLEDNNFSKKMLAEEKERQIEELKERLFEGQDHPSKENYGK